MLNIIKWMQITAAHTDRAWEFQLWSRVTKLAECLAAWKCFLYEQKQSMELYCSDSQSSVFWALLEVRLQILIPPVFQNDA